MNSAFSIVDHNGLSLLVYRPWWEEGILHGMTLGPLSFGGEALEQSAAIFCSATGVSLLANPKQTHGELFFDARPYDAWSSYLVTGRSLLRFGEYDGLIAPQAQTILDERVGYAITTADCVPVVIRGSSSWGVIHAGWRGLAQGIIGKVARAMGGVEQAVIFACAGGAAYEVGPEVLEAIGESASYCSHEDKFLLDTAKTARRQFLPFLAAERIEISGICTISDTRFHSHRRDGAAAGRSITFVSPRETSP